MKSINGKIPKLNLETIEITPNTDDNFEKLSTARVIDNMRKRTENYIIDNNILFDKLHEIQDEIKELRHIINSLHFPKPVNYNYPDNSSCYSPGTMYCTPPIESMLYKKYKPHKK